MLWPWKILEKGQKGGGGLTLELWQIDPFACNPSRNSGWLTGENPSRMPGVLTILVGRVAGTWLGLAGSVRGGGRVEGVWLWLWGGAILGGTRRLAGGPQS